MLGIFPEEERKIEVKNDLKNSDLKNLLRDRYKIHSSLILMHNETNLEDKLFSHYNFKEDDVIDIIILTKSPKCFHFKDIEKSVMRNNTIEEIEKEYPLYNKYSKQDNQKLVIITRIKE